MTQQTRIVIDPELHEELIKITKKNPKYRTLSQISREAFIEWLRKYKSEQQRG